MTQSSSERRDIESVLAGSQVAFSLPLPLRSTFVHIPLLSEGFSYVYSDGSKSDAAIPFIEASLTCGKPIVICSPTIHFVSEISSIAKRNHGSVLIAYDNKGKTGTLLHPEQSGAIRESPFVLYLVPEAYILRCYLHRYSQARNVLFPGHEMLPCQSVRFVGLGPTRLHNTEEILAHVRDAQVLVVFDRTLQNILHDIPVTCERHVLEYNYDDFAVNLKNLNDVLAHLHRVGKLEVVVATEGSPEIYDFADGLSTVRRHFAFVGGYPLVLRACERLEAQFGLTIVGDRFVLTSGFSARHGILTEELVTHLSELLRYNSTIMIMEMYNGDLRVVLNAIMASSRKKTLIMLTNMFSPDERVIVIDSDALDRHSEVHSLRGRFTTLVVVDDEQVGYQRSMFAGLGVTA